MGEITKILEQVNLLIHASIDISTKNKKLNKVKSVNKISAISSPKNKELYIAKNYI